MPPIVFKKFKDHPIEQCAICLEELVNAVDENSLDRLLEKINSSISEYNSKVINQRQKIFEELDLPNAGFIEKNRSAEYYQALSEIEKFTHDRKKLRISQFYNIS